MKHEIRISDLESTKARLIEDFLSRDMERFKAKIKVAVEKEVDAYLEGMAIKIHASRELGFPEVILSIEVPD